MELIGWSAAARLHRQCHSAWLYIEQRGFTEALPLSRVGQPQAVAAKFCSPDRGALLSKQHTSS